MTSHEDDEYRWAGVEDPKIVITTSRDPSSRLKMFAKVRRLSANVLFIRAAVASGDAAAAAVAGDGSDFWPTSSRSVALAAVASPPLMALLCDDR